VEAALPIVNVIYVLLTTVLEKVLLNTDEFAINAEP